MNGGLVRSLISHTSERLVAVHSFLSKTTTIQRFLIVRLNMFLLATSQTQSHTVVTTVPLGRSLLCFMSPSLNPTNLLLPHEHLHHQSFPPPSSHIPLLLSMAPLNSPLLMPPHLFVAPHIYLIYLRRMPQPLVYPTSQLSNLLCLQLLQRLTHFQCLPFLTLLGLPCLPGKTMILGLLVLCPTLMLLTRPHTMKPCHPLTPRAG